MNRISTDPLLLPVRPWFIFMSLFIALMLNLVPLGRLVWRPDLLALTLAFWCVQQPQRLGFVMPFLLGLLMDVHQGVLLGQHAFSYTLMCLGAVLMYRRILWFGLFGQMLHVLPLFMLLHVLELCLRLVTGGAFPGWWLFAAPVLETLLWPVADAMLLAPQRRPPDPDENRPL